MTAVPDKRVPDLRGSAASPSPVPDLWSRPRSYSEKKVFSDNSASRVCEQAKTPAPAAAQRHKSRQGPQENGEP